MRLDRCREKETRLLSSSFRKRIASARRSRDAPDRWPRQNRAGASRTSLAMHPDRRRSTIGRRKFRSLQRVRSTRRKVPRDRSARRQDRDRAFARHQARRAGCFPGRFSRAKAEGKNCRVTLACHLSRKRALAVANIRTRRWQIR